VSNSWHNTPSLHLQISSSQCPWPQHTSFGQFFIVHLGQLSFFSVALLSAVLSDRRMVSRQLSSKSWTASAIDWFTLSVNCTAHSMVLQCYDNTGNSCSAGRQLTLDFMNASNSTTLVNHTHTTVLLLVWNMSGSSQPVASIVFDNFVQQYAKTLLILWVQCHWWAYYSWWATYAMNMKQQKNEMKTDVCDVSQWWESVTC